MNVLCLFIIKFVSNECCIYLFIRKYIFSKYEKEYRIRIILNNFIYRESNEYNFILIKFFFFKCYIGS